MLPGLSFWHFLVIGAVALVVFGPHELPKLARMIAGYIRQARGMAKDFQRSFDEMGRQLELDELRREVDALRRGEPVSDVTNEIRAFERDLRAVDGATRADLRPSLLPPPTGTFPTGPAPSTTAPTGPVLVSSTDGPAASSDQPPAPTGAAEPPASTAEPPTPLVEDAPREDRKISGS
jgi:sec-independent protein translocase protein TatB